MPSIYQIILLTLQWLPTPLSTKSKLLVWASLPNVGPSYLSALTSYHASITVFIPGLLISLGIHQTHPAHFHWRVLVLHQLLPGTLFNTEFCMACSIDSERTLLWASCLNGHLPPVTLSTPGILKLLPSLYFLPNTHHYSHYMVYLFDYLLIICLHQLEGKLCMIRVFVCLVHQYPKCPCVEWMSRSNLGLS